MNRPIASAEQPVPACRPRATADAQACGGIGRVCLGGEPNAAVAQAGPIHAVEPAAAIIERTMAESFAIGQRMASLAPTRSFG